jgi:hypothetical protein
MKKVEVFLRHCFYSKLQEQPSRSRPSWWDKEKVFENFKRTLDPELINYTIIYDEHYGKIEDTFLKDEEGLVKINEGGEAKSFLKTLEYVDSQNFDDNTIIYFLEDDYVHRDNWTQVLIEGFDIKVNEKDTVKYITLYDHGDKYSGMYSSLMSRVLITENSHWRPVPSTTNTFATTFGNLKDDLDIHVKYSTDVEPSNDHIKFLELSQKGKYLASSIPGYSTHCHSEFLSPCIDWEKYL